MPIDEALQIEAGYFAQMVATQDIPESIAAWFGRRKLQFTGT